MGISPMFPLSFIDLKIRIACKLKGGGRILSTLVSFLKTTAASVLKTYCLMETGISQFPKMTAFLML